MMIMDALDRAIQKVGGLADFAERIGLRRSQMSTVAMWRARKRVPAERCIAIETATDGAVTRYDLRPDVFGPPPAVKADPQPQAERAA
jgi:DNA-binding transcriptional regulator YdaS (Cro superfamily)